MDPIADLLTCIRNANQALKPEITVPHSKIKESTVKLLKEELELRRAQGPTQASQDNSDLVRELEEELQKTTKQMEE